MRILLVDDHALLRGGMVHLLRGLDASVEVDEAENAAQALDYVARRSYDLVLLDLKMPGLSGLDALDAVRSAVEATPVVVLSGEEDARVVRAAIDHGAMGFIPKSATPGVLIQALKLVLAHGVYLPHSVLEEDAWSPPVEGQALQAQKGAEALSGLTPRQIDVLRCVIRGKPNKVIARELDVSEATVKTHLSAVLRALRVNNRTEAVYAAAKLGLQIA